METFGAQVVASPSPDTQSGKKVLEQDPDSPGSLGIAISEAVEDAAHAAAVSDQIADRHLVRNVGIVHHKTRKALVDAVIP